jgi:NitT/TauT family transport system substrate-binding protein
VQRFVDASITGWYNYLYGDNAGANALIKKDNPEMTDGQIAFSIKQAGGFDPIVLMMADFGYDTYSTTIETSQKLVDENPDLVQRFVNATIEGWYNYLYGDNAKANAMIKADNPEMTDEQIAFSIEAMKQYGIVDSGDALTMGIGAMTDARWESFFTKSVIWGVYPAYLPYKTGYTTKFVNQGHGLELKKKLTGG